LASVLLDQLRYEEAGQSAHRAIRADDRNAEAYHVRALLRERKQDRRGAERDDRRAWRLDPERYPRPLLLDDATVEAVVTEAIVSCPDHIRAALANVPVILDELPNDEVCLSFDPPRSPVDLVGLFSGPTLVEMGTDAVWTASPPTITLYRKNLQRVAATREELLDEVRVTLIHEVGHFLGLSEEELEDRGLD
jgi:predicted Zn-dependent protease with MMP-like domain